MKPTIAFCIALACAAGASSAPAAEISPTSLSYKRHGGHAPHHLYGAVPATPAEKAQNEATAPPASSWLTRLFPNVRPYPPGQGNVDGLSREREDCNTGCIGGVTPR
jgi:hypothetical protein